MLPENIHKTIPFSRLFRLVLGMAVFLQIILVAYNHFSGYHQLYGFQEYILRVLRGVAYSIVAGFAIAYPDLYLVQSLNARLPWKNNIVKRLSIQDPTLQMRLFQWPHIAAHWMAITSGNRTVCHTTFDLYVVMPFLCQYWKPGYLDAA